jgi:serine/threonine-protein kinase RsbW
MMRIELDSRLPEISRALDLVRDFSERHALAERDESSLCIVLDELLTNAIRHGLRDEPGHAITVSLDCRDGEIVLEVEDDGVEFDPTRAAPPVTTGTLSERTTGGLGIAFVRELADAVAYERSDGRNRLTVRRRVSG